MISVLKLVRLALWPLIWSILGNVLRAFEKNGYSPAGGSDVLETSAGSAPTFLAAFLSGGSIHF